MFSGLAWTILFLCRLLYFVVLGLVSSVGQEIG